MNAPKLALLVNGGPDSIEAVRARGLAQRHPPERLLFLFRDADRRATASRWRDRLESFQPQLLYIVNTALPGIQTAWQWHRRGVPFILDTGDAVFEMARSAGTAPWWRLPLLWAGERRAQKLASTIVVRGTRHREHLLQHGFNQVELIRDGYVERDEPEARLVSDCKRRLGLEGAFVAGLMGSLVFSPKLGICYGWDLLQALAELGGLNVRGLIIGDGPGRGWLEARARELGVAERVVFAGRVPYEQVPLHLRLLDVAISTQSNNLAGQVRTTGKLPEYMAAGRFILATRVGEAALVLPEAMLMDYAGAVDTRHPSRLAGRLRELATEPQQMNLAHGLPGKARKLFNYEVLSREFDRVVAGAAPSSAGGR
jgi:glycosyltransferase involved in cell wall biosynthesis